MNSNVGTCSTWVSKLSPNSWNDSQLTIEHEFCSAIFNGLRWNFYERNWTSLCMKEDILKKMEIVFEMYIPQFVASVIGQKMA